MQANTTARDEFKKRQQALLRLIGANIKEYRLQKGWSEEKLAAKCNITEHDLKELEAGADINYEDTKLLERISSVLVVKLNQLYK
jgi:ribosome-binding protein aMBF1 (putative translation factor)